MARVTVEDCLLKVDNRFSLVHLAAKRVRQLREGAPPLMETKNKEVVLALREIADGRVYQVSAEEAQRARDEAEARERQRLNVVASSLEEEEPAAIEEQDDPEDEEADPEQ